MTDLFFKLLGVPAEQVARVADSRLRFRGDVDPLWILLAALGLGVLVFLMYRKAAPDLSPVRKYVLATLRTVFLLLILILLMRPVWAFTIESTVRRELVLMFDNSTSMKIEDPRSDPDDLKRVAIAKGQLDPAAGLKQTLTSSAAVEKVSRLDLLRTVFKSDKFALLPRLAKDYNVDAFTFDSALTDLPAASVRQQQGGTAATQPTDTAWLDALSPAGQQTAVGDALRAVIARKRGQPMAGVVLVTDGANNSGSDPRAAAQLAKDARVPLYIYGVGITSPKNLVVGNIFAPEISFVKDEVPVTVRVKSQGISNAKVTLKLVDANGQEQTVDQKDVAFDQDNEPAVALKFTPKIKGDYQLKAVAEPADASLAELSKDDNASAQGLKVIETKIKVLLVDQAPRWEFKYLMAQLLRDRRVEAKVVLLEASPGLAQTPDSPYLAKLPDTKEALFKYDLIILGDVDAKAFSSSQLEAIEEFVTKFGGGLALIAGKKNNPWTYRKTPIEKMLPVELEAGAGFVNQSAGPGGAEDLSDKPVKLELTAVGKRTPMLRLDPDDATSERIWARLPPIFWVAPVARAKPAAEVFLVDPSPGRSTRYGKMPVVAAQQYGMGQVMYVGTDNTWRWRKNKGDEQYVTLWGQVIQRLALPHLLGASKRTQLTLDKKEYVTNEKVNLYARLYTESYSPITQDKVKAYVTDTGPDDPRAREIILRPLPDQPGMYRGEFNAPEKPAPYKLYVELDKSTLVDLPVSEPKIEPGENALNAELLESLARTTGGKFVREEDLHSLPDQIKAETPKVITNLEVELWTSPLYFALMLLVVSAEWIMRKLVQLK